MKKISSSYRFLAASLIAIAGLASTACSGDDEPAAPAGAPPADGTAGSSGGDPGVAPGPGDTSGQTPAANGPSVVSTTPANGAKAVGEKTAIVVKFDRAMDVASVAAAYSSNDLPKDAVTFAWNAGEDELTITPSQPLAYAKGGPDVAAKTYAIAFSTAAKDKSGLALSKEHALSFTTLRRIAQAMPMTSILTGRALSNDTFSSASLAAGDMMTADVEREARAAFTFLIEALPESGIVVESATLKVAISAYTGTPDTLGGLTTEHVFFSVGTEAYAAEPVAGANAMLVLAFNGQGPAYRTTDVTAMLQDDLANRVARTNRSQYRFRYLNGQNNDGTTDLAGFDKSDATLTVVYVGE